ncbi:hypothetical protein NTE_03480 [Candidatus Nitrososphaera evergladensis SR1]|uniref:Uncharacterized protein n=1 Tax=Candidatus Nitrososphaera evergladensis SR1 TaxID=1459636 RepID=A0A075MWK4_9ARCH|nr:hypothetical protein NTE_03480 [Candidatus Nitrososphaera evergladensis SR1]
MDHDFIMLAVILAAIGSAGIYTGVISHPIMYINSVVIFGGLGYMVWQLDRDQRVTKKDARWNL